MPAVPGVEIEAICKAARTVSGDYYDFIQLSPTRIAIAIADISGKGISAALLMASLQAALRSQLLAPGSESMSTAELVSRLNRHLVRNTGDDRFATFFVAVYDSVALAALHERGPPPIILYLRRSRGLSGQRRNGVGCL